MVHVEDFAVAEQTPIDPGHNSLRDRFRVAGPFALALGGLLIAAAIIDFCASFGSMRTPTLFIWCPFPGIVLLGLGFMMTQAGYAGRITRYYSQEVAPPAVDTFNYVAHEAKDGIREVAGAIGEGLRDAIAASTTGSAGAAGDIRCSKCQHENATDARFCSACGFVLAAFVACPGCTHSNTPEAKFCDQCGHALA